MKNYLLIKSSLCLVMTFAVLLPALNLSAAHREEEQRMQEQRMHQNMHRMNPMEREHMNQGVNSYEKRALKEGYYGGYGNYGSSGSGTVVVPTNPQPGSQPGMTDDSNELYHYDQPQSFGHQQ